MNDNDKGKKIIIQDGDLAEEIISGKEGAPEKEEGQGPETAAGKEDVSGGTGNDKDTDEAKAAKDKPLGSKAESEEKDGKGEEHRSEDGTAKGSAEGSAEGNAKGTTEGTAEGASDGADAEAAGDGNAGEAESDGLASAKDKRDAVIADLKDRFQRQLAEFENFRKRTEKEKDGMFEAGSRSVIEKILPVVDNFERALENPPEDEASKAFTEGIQMIYKQLMQELEKLGTKPIEAVGKPFDPNLHNAVMQVESEEYESGTVAQELQRGYTYHGTVVRHSMVSVVE